MPARPLQAVERDTDRPGEGVDGLKPMPHIAGGQPVRLVTHYRDRLGLTRFDGHPRSGAR
jgi:hypothetical protein